MRVILYNKDVHLALSLYGLLLPLVLIAPDFNILLFYLWLQIYCFMSQLSNKMSMSCGFYLYVLFYIRSIIDLCFRTVYFCVPLVHSSQTCYEADL